MTKLEECARAAQAALVEETGGFGEDDDAKVSLLIARSVLLALREPDDAMIEAAGEVATKIAEDGANYIPGVTPDWDYGTAAIAQHEAMIDAVLDNKA